MFWVHMPKRNAFPCWCANRTRSALRIANCGAASFSEQNWGWVSTSDWALGTEIPSTAYRRVRPQCQVGLAAALVKGATRIEA